MIRPSDIRRIAGKRSGMRVKFIGTTLFFAGYDDTWPIKPNPRGLVMKRRLCNEAVYIANLKPISNQIPQFKRRGKFIGLGCGLVTNDEAMQRRGCVHCQPKTKIESNTTI